MNYEYSIDSAYCTSIIIKKKNRTRARIEMNHLIVLNISRFVVSTFKASRRNVTNEIEREMISFT